MTTEYLIKSGGLNLTVKTDTLREVTRKAAGQMATERLKRSAHLDCHTCEWAKGASMYDISRDTTTFKVNCTASACRKAGWSVKGPMPVSTEFEKKQALFREITAAYVDEADEFEDEFLTRVQDDIANTKPKDVPAIDGAGAW